MLYLEGRKMTPDEERKHLTVRIEQVKADIEHLSQTGLSGAKLEVLSFYLEYLQDELKMLREKLSNDNGS